MHYFMQPFINLSVEDYDAFYCLQLLDVFFSLLGCDWLLCNLFSCWKLFMKSQTICEYWIINIAVKKVLLMLRTP